MAVTDHSTEYMDGWHAHKAGRVSGENPYSEELTAFSYRRWLSGWCGRFGAVKHGQSLELDDVYE